MMDGVVVVVGIFMGGWLDGGSIISIHNNYQTKLFKLK